jgi:hypothetical protein
MPANVPSHRADGRSPSRQTAGYRAKQDHLHAAKMGDGLASALARHHGVQHLGQTALQCTFLLKKFLDCFPNLGNNLFA